MSIRPNVGSSRLAALEAFNRIELDLMGLVRFAICFFALHAQVRARH
jgi:hypothetical protein